MEPREYEIMSRAEDSHWWYRGMAAIARAVLKGNLPRGRDLRILDAGCGTGGAMAWLSDFGFVTGLDRSFLALRHCRMRGRQAVSRASVMEIPHPAETFDLVTSLDVIYFQGVRDEVAIREFFRVLRPGGRLLLRVPAYDWLRGVHDRKVSTGHRYTRRELEDKLRSAGFRLHLLSHANAILFPLALVKRLAEKWLPHQKDSDLAIGFRPLDSLLGRCLSWESRLITRCGLPFGLSIFALAERPADRG